MGTTSTLGFDKMADSDSISQVAQYQRNSVDDIDAHLRLAETAQAWQTASLSNFSTLAGWPITRFRKKAGMREVRVEGAATRTSSNLAAGATIFTLPSGFRPTGGNQTIIGYTTTGAVAFFTISTGGAVTANVAINIGISFVFCGDISLD